MITITDHISGQTVTCATCDVAEAISPWYPQAPAEVTGAVQRLEDALRAGTDLGDLAEFLDVSIESA